MYFFACDVCETIDTIELVRNNPLQGKFLCSLCHPDYRQWHGVFEAKMFNPEVDVVMNRVVGDDGLTISLG